MFEKIVAHLIVEYDERSGQLKEYHFVGGSLKPRSSKSSAPINRLHLQELVRSYWKFVDDAIKQETMLSPNENQRETFMSELEARGQEICSCIFAQSTQSEIWRCADEADILLITTNLNEVPWEALYCSTAGANSGFLAENCVIQRQLDGGDIEGSIPSPKRDGPFLCVDSELIAEEEKRGGTFVAELNAIRAEFYPTSSSRQLSDKVRDAGIIHWICENVVEKGLRLGKNSYYSTRDIDTHRFPKNSVLFMLSCGSGRYDPDSNGYSARVSAASGCTVVAPSSMVAVSEAVHFVKDIQHVLEQNPDCRLADVWTLLKNPIGGRRDETAISVRDCYLLWFGIYGDCSVPLVGQEGRLCR